MINIKIAIDLLTYDPHCEILDLKDCAISVCVKNLFSKMEGYNASRVCYTSRSDLFDIIIRV